MNKPKPPMGNESREAVASLGGYVYQIYQAALAWLELGESEFLFLEVAEDFVTAAQAALTAVQVKNTTHNVTINSDDIIQSINSFVEIRLKNPELAIKLRHLTTSKIGIEKSAVHRIGSNPTLETWRSCSKTGDVTPLRNILLSVKLSQQTKDFIGSLNDKEFREEFLKRIHFDCGAIESGFLKRQLLARIISLLQARGGTVSQATECLNNILVLLLEKSTQKTDRFVDRASLESLLDEAAQIRLSRSQFEAQSALIAKALSASIPKSTDLVSSRLAKPVPVNDVPLPRAIAERTIYVSSIVSSLENYGVGWILGAAGVGKTLTARLAAIRAGGNWATVNLRGLSPDQVSELLSFTCNFIAEETDIHGLLVDDLECAFEPNVVDNFLNLLSVCKRRDLLVLVTSPRAAPADLLFVADIPSAIETTLGDFNEEDVGEILTGLGVDGQKWSKYIYLISGCGHPQLTIATIQSMQRAAWDDKELKNINSLLSGNPEVEKVRSRTRQRLLNELPGEGRRLLERLSVALRGFKRELVLDLAQITPTISDAGILLDQFIGSWIDQQEKDRFSLSPLLANFAANTLTPDQIKTINFEIAKSLTKSQSIDPIEANSALLAAWLGKNEGVIIKLCLAIIGSDNSDMQLIAPHFLFFTFLRTDQRAYEENPIISQMLRGAQILLLCFEETLPERFLMTLESFQREIDGLSDRNGRAGMALIIYSKLLLCEPVFGPVPQFWEIAQKLDALLRNQGYALSIDNFTAISEIQNSGQAIGFMFLFQAHQLRKIDELVSVFNFLDSCEEEFRAKVFEPYDIPEMNMSVEMLISGAWLKEHDENTIDAIKHVSAYAHMEDLANGWGRQRLAVACRKYQVVILDEYGNDKEKALLVLNEALIIYGNNNSELIRTKAKVLYRANDHQASLEISRSLIESNAPLSEAEKAFLGREAAISAEKQGDFQTARRYYLFGSTSAKATGLPDMIPMHVGLLADAALASWHLGERENCLRDIVTVLEKLEALDAKSSLRAAHCHAVFRHALVWLNQEATGEERYISNGEILRIYPGIVSNPEPHPNIDKRFLPALGLSWYMLAELENECLIDIGITEEIDAHLPNGPIREGSLLLTKGQLFKAFHLRNVELFLSSLAKTVAEFALASKLGEKEKFFNIENITYGIFPPPTLEEMIALSALAEQLLLSFAATCIFNDDNTSFDQLLAEIDTQEGFNIRDEIVQCLTGISNGTEYNARFASLLSNSRNIINDRSLLVPTDVFELVLKIVQAGKQVGQSRLLSKQALVWLGERWSYILQEQRFLLRQPSFYEQKVKDAFETQELNGTVKLLIVLLAILPTLGISNESEIEGTLLGMLKPLKNVS